MSMKSLIILFFFIFLMNERAISQDFVCKSKNAKVFYSDILLTINQKIESLENIIQGKPATFTLAHIWGQELIYENTKAEIEKLEAELKTDENVPLEYKQLFDCLANLKQFDSVSALQKAIQKLTELKIVYLKKNLESKNLISSTTQSSDSIPNLKDQLDQERAKVEKLKDEIQKEVLLAEVKLAKEKDSVSKEVIAYKSLLERVKLEIIKVNENYVNSLENHLKEFEKQSAALANVGANLKILSTLELVERYQTVSTIWEKVITDAFRQIKDEAKKFDFPEVPAVPSILKNVEEQRQLELKKAYQDVVDLRSKSISEVISKKNKEVEVQNNLLLQVNLVRSELFRNLPLSYFSQEVFSWKFWQLVKTEVIASPYRVVSFFFAKYLYLKEQIAQGYSGYKKLSVGLISMMLVGVLFLLLHRLLGYFILQSDKLILFSVIKFKTNKIVKYVSKLWLKFKDNASDLLWIYILQLLETYDFFLNFRLVLECVIVILVYRIMRRVIVVGLGIITSIDVRNFQAFKIRAQETSLQVGKIYLFYSLSMLFLEGVLGQTYVYSLINLVTLIFAISVVIKLATDWEKEIASYLEKNISGLIVEKIEKATSLLPQKLKAITHLFFLAALSLFNLFIYLTEDFEISKKISANIFKKQIESLETDGVESRELPNDYKERFSLHSLSYEEDFVYPETTILEDSFKEVQEWYQQESEEHSLLLYGDKGIGKTTLAKKLMSQVKDKFDVDTIYTKMPSKVLTKEKLVSFLLSEMCLEDCQTFDPTLIDSRLDKPLVIFLDETQNTFLSESGGFEAYYALLNLVNLDMKKVFWVFVMNKYSWLYLDKAYGQNQFFRNVFEYAGWSDRKIKELIMQRHHNTSYKLSYDVLINITKSEDEVDRYTTIENKFFKLLWELSRGNPRTALYLWTNALKRKSKNMFTVFVPKIGDDFKLLHLPDDTLFVLATVLKHENLSLKEIERTTNLPLGICRNSVKVSLENDLLFKDERNRYMVDLKKQYSLIRHLKSKNFIYGS